MIVFNKKIFFFSFFFRRSHSLRSWCLHQVRKKFTWSNKSSQDVLVPLPNINNTGEFDKWKRRFADPPSQGTSPQATDMVTQCFLCTAIRLSSPMGARVASLRQGLFHGRHYALLYAKFCFVNVFSCALAATDLVTIDVW